MADSSEIFDNWRDYFRTANSDIFDIIEHAIMVAASDCPNEFKVRRDRIAEMLFTCRTTKCLGCHRVELAVPNGDVDGEVGDGNCKSGLGGGCGAGGSNDSNVNSNKDGEEGMNVNQVSYGCAEALTDELEEVSRVLVEVERIKNILDNCEDESESTLFDSLRRLELMDLAVETLKATEIGKSVNVLRKHGSQKIRNLARKLIVGWKTLVDDWVSASQAIAGAEGSPEFKLCAVDEEEEEEAGLPSPPLDEGAFFTHPTSLEFSEFFDGMDDGNPRNGGEFSKNRDSGPRQSLENRNIPPWKQPLPNHSSSPKDRKGEQPRKQETAWKKEAPVVKPNKPVTDGSGVGRTPQSKTTQTVNKTEPKWLKKSDKADIPKKPMASQQDKPESSDASAIQLKLEAAKRKLQERYQEVENAKKQRTIQVMELHDIPKQKNTHMKPGNHNRHRTNGRW